MEISDNLHQLFSNDDVTFIQRYLAHAESLINGELLPKTEKDQQFLEFVNLNLAPGTRFERLWRNRQNAITVQIQQNTINSLNEKIEDYENKNHALTVSVKSYSNKTEELKQEITELRARYLEKIKELKNKLGIEPEPRSPIPKNNSDDGHVDWWREQV